jgi:uncharacterized protein (DUF2062 family)
VRAILRGVVVLLRQGLTPRRIALGLTLAMIVAVLPVLVLPMMICALIALCLGLNQPLMQMINYVAGPIQFVLFIPFLRLGEKLLGLPPTALNPAALRAILQQDVATIMHELSCTIGVAALGWAVCAPAAGIALYWAFFGCTRFVSERNKEPARLGLGACLGNC